jgi:hypothetical protein
VSRWLNLDEAIARGIGLPLCWGDELRVTGTRGETLVATWQRSPGGGSAFYNAEGEPVDVVSIEVSR